MFGLENFFKGASREDEKEVERVEDMERAMENQELGEFGVKAEDLAKSVNIFISGRGSVSEETVNEVLKKANLSKEDVMALIDASGDRLPDNGLTDNANLAYLNSLRLKIADAIE